MLLVGPGAGVTYHSIGEALAAAGPGAEVRIRPGLYRESLVISRPVHLAGEGPREAIVVECADDCLVLDADEATVRGLTLRNLGDEHAVRVTHGRPLLEDCAITAGGACVVVTGQHSHPVLRGCLVHDSKQGSGLVFDDQAGGTVEDCEVRGNHLAGVEVLGVANPIVRACRIHDNGDCGVIADNLGQGQFVECDIQGNRVAGVCILGTADPTILRCRIHGTREGSAVVCEGGLGTVTGCDLRQNAGGAWALAEGAEVVRQGNRE